MNNIAANFKQVEIEIRKVTAKYVVVKKSQRKMSLSGKSP